MERHHTRRPRQIADLPPEARTLRRAVVTWALAHGRRVDFDALTVILAVKACSTEPLRRFTEDDVWRLWWVELSRWCAQRGIAVPEAMATSMNTLFDHLDACDGFAPDSDDREALADAMDLAGASWRGRRAPAPAS